MRNNVVFGDFQTLMIVTFFSALLAFMLGMFWYHPKILGRKWMDIRGLRENERALQTSFPFVFSFMLWMMASLFYTFLAGFHGVDSASGFLCLASLLWVAFAMPPTLMGALYTGYPFQAVAIDSSYQLAGYYMFALVHIIAQWVDKLPHGAPAVAVG